MWRILAFCLLATWPACAVELVLPDGRTVHLETQQKDGSEWICLDKLAKVVGGVSSRDPLSRYPVWTVGKHRVLFSTATPVTSVDGKILSTGRAAQDRDGCIWLPDSVLQLVLPLALEGDVRLKGPVVELPPAAVTPTPPPAGATKPTEAADLVVTATTAADAVRIEVAGTGISSAKARKEGDALLLPFPRGRAATETIELGSGIALRAEVVDEGRMLRLVLGPGYREYETSAQKSPERITLVARGDGALLAPAAAVAGGSPAEPKARTARKAGEFLVAVDPGHGGSDTGALAKDGTTEKDLVLAVSKLLVASLEKAGMKAFLTREGDTFIPLAQRTGLANFNSADVLLSIHLNASPSSSAKGSETYIMSREATDLWSKQVAEKENATAAQVTGSDTFSLVLWNLAQTQSILESAELAEGLQNRLNQLLATKERGVRQAPFVVLEGAQMPAVLVEIAFLSNPQEAEQLKDAAFQAKVAEEVATSVADFKAKNHAPPAP